MLLAPSCFDFFPSLSFLLQLFSLLSLSFILCFPCYSLFTCYTPSLLPFISNSVSLFSSIVFPIASLIFPPIRLFHISSLLLSLLPLLSIPFLLLSLLHDTLHLSWLFSLLSLRSLFLSCCSPSSSAHSFPAIVSSILLSLTPNQSINCLNQSTALINFAVIGPFCIIKCVG